MKKVYYIGLDTHKETIAVAIAESTGEVRVYGQIGGTLEVLDKAIKRMEQPDVELRFVYEAGPCGYVIYRHLTQRGFGCLVVSPSLVPKKSSDRVKTWRGCFGPGELREKRSVNGIDILWFVGGCKEWRESRECNTRGRFIM